MRNGFGGSARANLARRRWVVGRDERQHRRTEVVRRIRRPTRTSNQDVQPGPPIRDFARTLARLGFDLPVLLSAVGLRIGQRLPHRPALDLKQGGAVATGQLLRMHANTVRYRIRQAEQRLGRDITDMDPRNA